MNEIVDWVIGKVDNGEAHVFGQYFCCVRLKTEDESEF